MWERGYIPYKDSFDHKGPLLYIINLFGNKLLPVFGIWLIELGFLTIAFWGMYKISRMLCDTFASVVVLLIASSPLFKYYEGGNLTEEYAMLFIVIALYIFMKYELRNSIWKGDLVVSGVCLGFTLLLRPNMIAVWFVFCVAIFVSLIRQSKWSTLIKYVGWFSLGIFCSM